MKALRKFSEKVITTIDIYPRQRNPSSPIHLSLEFAQDRMKKKVLGAAETVQGGCGRVIFGDARLEKPVTAALEGKGTVVS